jgi:hypothetical protein
MKVHTLEEIAQKLDQRRDDLLAEIPIWDELLDDPRLLPTMRETIRGRIRFIMDAQAR